LLCGLCVSSAAAQTVAVNPNYPHIPAAMTLYAGAGDQTFCAIALLPANPGVTFRCSNNSGHLTTTTITNTAAVSYGDVCALFHFDWHGNARVMEFEASVNLRSPPDLAGKVVTNVMQSSGIVTWPVVAAKRKARK
jgi:hypothetical protein